MTLVIPRDPASLVLEIRRRWDGTLCDDPRLRGRVELAARTDGLHIEGRLTDPTPARVPDAPEGSRVVDLWHYDVVECFLVGRGGRYLEVELGAGGHFLVLSFSAVRERCDEHEDLTLVPDHQRDPRAWRTALTLPWHCVPEGLCGINAFALARGEHLAFHSLPGQEPDFHQPHRYPSVLLAR